jgi:hypothetical protein
MKILIIEPTLINHGDDRGGQHADIGITDAPKDAARAVVLAGKALYVSRADDPSKSGTHTATAEEVKAAQAAAKAAQAAAKAAQAAAE